MYACLPYQRKQENTTTVMITGERVCDVAAPVTMPGWSDLPQDCLPIDPGLLRVRIPKNSQYGMIIMGVYVPIL